MTSRNQARLSILSDILQFFTTSDWSPNGPKTPALRGLIPCGYSIPDSDPRVGDLVVLSSAPPSKWTIGWLREIEEGGHYGSRYLIESLEDQELCWWTNVSLSFYPRDQLRARWQWDDNQYAFQKRWARTYRKHGTGKANEAIFHDDGSVTLGCRGYWDFSLEADKKPPPITRHFPSYKKTTIKMMREAIAEMDAEREEKKYDPT